MRDCTSGFIEVVPVKSVVLDAIHKYLNQPTANNYLHEDEAITYTAKYPDGFEMAVRCCGVRDDDDYRAYTEAILYKNGEEVARSDVSDKYEGTWTLGYDRVEYTAIIKREEESVSA